MKNGQIARTIEKMSLTGDDGLFVKIGTKEFKVLRPVRDGKKIYLETEEIKETKKVKPAPKKEKKEDDSKTD